MQKILKSIDMLAERISRAEGEEAVNLATAVKILTDSWGMQKEIEIHEKYHLAVENQLPGEAPLKGVN